MQFYQGFVREQRRLAVVYHLKLAGVLLALFAAAYAGPAVFFALLAVWCILNGWRPAIGVIGANALYDAGRGAFLTADIDMSTDDIVVALVAASLYTPNLTTHDFLDDIAGGAIIATSDPMTGITTTAGVFDADDVLLPAVPGGLQGDFLIIYQDSGSSATSRLIGKIDTGTNLPVTPNGGDINIAWSNGSSKIFKL